MLRGLQRHFSAFRVYLVSTPGLVPLGKGGGPVPAFDDLPPSDSGIVRAKRDLPFLCAVGNHAHFRAAEIIGPEILEPHPFHAEYAPFVAG